MANDVTIAALAIGLGLASGWAVIHILWNASRGFRKATRWIACGIGRHAPSGKFEPANEPAGVGGRDVQRCLYCDKVVYEVKRSKGTLRRTM